MIGWGIIIVPYQEHSCSFCTCDITPFSGGLMTVVLCCHEHSCRRYYFQYECPEKLRTFRTPLTHLDLLGCSAMANQEHS